MTSYKIAKCRCGDFCFSNPDDDYTTYENAFDRWGCLHCPEDIGHPKGRMLMLRFNTSPVPGSTDKFKSNARRLLRL